MSDDARLKRHSDRIRLAEERAREAQRSIHDVEETYTDFERAVMRHVRKLEDGNRKQNVWGPIILIALQIAESLVSHFWK